MAAQVRHIMSPQQRKANYLSRMSDEQLQCRAGHRHSFPSDHLSRKMRSLPKGMQVEVRQGVYQIEEECERGCGRIRYYATRGGAIFDTDVVYQYKTSEDKRRDWVTVPETEEFRITGRDCKGEMFDRVAPLIQAAARRSTAQGGA
jgi:hypothetical protein